MLFKMATLERIRDGSVTLAFRRWTRPTVRAGGTLKTAAGILAIDAIDAVELDDISDADVQAAGFAGRDALLAELARSRGGGVYRIAFHRAADDPRTALRERDTFDESEFTDLKTLLDKLDRSSPHDPWTTRCLVLIGERDGRTAGEIAAELGWDKPVLKRKVRQLKEQGLTESLTSGYRLSPRGHAYLRQLSQAAR